jgi:hypothetical protein
VRISLHHGAAPVLVVLASASEYFNYLHYTSSDPPRNVPSAKESFPTPSAFAPGLATPCGAPRGRPRFNAGRGRRNPSQIKSGDGRRKASRTEDSRPQSEIDLISVFWFVADSPLHHCLYKWKDTRSRAACEQVPVSHIYTLRYLFLELSA